MSSHQPCSPQDRGNLDYDQLVRPALGGQEGTPLRSSSRVVSGSSRASEREGPQGDPRVGVGACAEERPNPASTSNPNCPATPRQRGFSRLAGTSGCGPGTTRTTEPFPRRGTSPRAPPTQFSLQRNRRTPERAQNLKATSPGPCHAAPNHRRGPAGVRPPPGARAGRGRGGRGRDPRSRPHADPRAVAGRTPPPGALRGEQRPPARADSGSQSWGRRAGVRALGSAPASPPTGIVLAATSGPSTPPPPARPSGSPARAPPRPASPAAMNM